MPALKPESAPMPRPKTMLHPPSIAVSASNNVSATANASDDPNWADALDTGLLAVLPEDTGETLSPLAAFLTHAALEAGDNQAQAGQDAVQLMTVHAAKGLEFDCVFITGLEEGLFPHENSSSDRASLEEERRLMYVAITRARKRLYITHSQTRMLHGQTRYNLRSRFFDELPEASMRWLTPKGGSMNLGGAGGLAVAVLAGRALARSGTAVASERLAAVRAGEVGVEQAPRTVEQTMLTSQAVAAVLAQKMPAYRRLAPRWSPSPGAAPTLPWASKCSTPSLARGRC
jgi:hypothetical protein